MPCWATFLGLILLAAHHKHTSSPPSRRLLGGVCYQRRPRPQPRSPPSQPRAPAPARRASFMPWTRVQSAASRASSCSSTRHQRTQTQGKESSWRTAEIFLSETALNLFFAPFYIRSTRAGPPRRVYFNHRKAHLGGPPSSRLRGDPLEVASTSASRPCVVVKVRRRRPDRLLMLVVDVVAAHDAADWEHHAHAVCRAACMCFGSPGRRAAGVERRCEGNVDRSPRRRRAGARVCSV